MHWIPDAATVESIVQSWGYLAIFFFMTLESMFIPFPSEIVMIPAWIYAAKGILNLRAAILAGTLGSIFGAMINYYIAHWGGRPLLQKMIDKKLIKKDHWEKGEEFFKKNGNAATFIGRLIPVVRQYISFPAGLWKMNIWQFAFYTGLGAGIWLTFLAILGYISYKYFSDNPHLIQKYQKIGSVVILLAIVLFVVFKYRLHLYLKNMWKWKNGSK